MGPVNLWFEKQLTGLEEYADEQVRVAEEFRKSEAELLERDGFVFEPTISMPSLDIKIEAYLRFSMRILTTVMKFDRAMDQFDFMVWNGIRDQEHFQNSDGSNMRQSIALIPLSKMLRLRGSL
jgi:hypothetical protein